MSDAGPLLPFVPPLGVERFLVSGRALDGPRVERFPAATLFADVSGFTALVESLLEEGTRGAERVQGILNQVFGPLTEIIEQAGGEVLKFPGDAALALIPGAPGEGPEAPLARAAGAALETTRKLDRLRVEQGRELRLRVAVGAGTVWAAVVGGVGDRYEVLVRGTPIDQLGPTLELAHPGEALVAPEAADLEGAGLRGPRRSGALHLEAVERPPPRPSVAKSHPSAEELGKFVPRTVQARLAAGQGEFLAEFRRVTVAFVNLRGLDREAPDALERLQHGFTTIQEATERYGGSVNQVVEDDKGTVVVLAFGVALHAHTDDPVRATLASLEIRERLQRQGLDARVGITTDRVFTGWRGGQRRAEYAPIGSSVNLAGRLMQRAETVLCDAATRAAARKRILFESLEPVRVKGRADAVAIYRPRASRADPAAAAFPGTGAALIGREPERKLLERRLAELDASGAGGVVFVEGEPGIGKTRLMRHLVDGAQGSAVRTLVGLADATEQQTSLLAWKPVVTSLLGSFVAPDENGVAKRLAELLGAERAGQFPLLNPLLPVRLADTELARRMAPQGRAEAIRQLVRDLLRSATGSGPVLLVLEDGHWMDSASWELAESAVREARNLLLVICLRPMSERPPPCKRMLEDISTTVVRLDVLDDAETLGLVCRLLDVDSLPSEVASFIHRQAEGHPFYSEELAFALRDSGRIEISGGECRLVGSPDELHGLELSQTLSGAVNSRIDGLSPQQQLTLKVASVLGRHFDLEGLRAAHPIERDHEALEQQLRDMVELGLLRDRGEQESDYDFRHALIRDAAYELLPYAQRCEFHSRTARWLRQRFAAEIDRFHAVLGHHHEAAEEWDAAIPHLVQAGDNALAHWENAEAAHFFGRAIRLDDQLGRERDAEEEIERAAWERKYGDALCMLGDHARGVPSLRSALVRLGVPVPESRGALLRGMLPRLMGAIARRPKLPAASSLGPREKRVAMETVKALNRLGASAYPRGESVEGLYLLLRSRTLAARLGPGAELALADMNIANIAAFVRRIGVARSYTAEAVETAEASGDLATLGAALTRGHLWNVAIPEFGAVEPIERGLAILEEVGDHYLWEEGNAVLARLLLSSGDLEGSLARSRAVLARARTTGAIVHQLWCLAAIAEVQLRQGQLDDAIATAQETLALSRSSASPDPNGPLQAAGVLASAWLRRHGEPPEPAVLEVGHGALEAGGWLGYSPQAGFTGLAEARFAALDAGKGDPADQEKALGQLARQLSRATFARPVVGPVRRWFAAERDWRRGRQRRALGRLRAALATAEGMQLPFEAAVLRVQLARRLDVEAPERSSLLDAAVESFAGLGARFELDAAQELRGAR
jgi:class 3 adenylate cyclase